MPTVVPVRITARARPPLSHLRHVHVAGVKVHRHVVHAAEAYRHVVHAAEAHGEVVDRIITFLRRAHRVRHGVVL